MLVEPMISLLNKEYSLTIVTRLTMTHIWVTGALLSNTRSGSIASMANKNISGTNVLSHTNKSMTLYLTTVTKRESNRRNRNTKTR